LHEVFRRQCAHLLQTGDLLQTRPELAAPRHSARVRHQLASK
jgi:hypothetical protein